MGDNSKIQWTDATWNPVVGCSVVSPGCTNCYAMKMAARIEAIGTARTSADGSPGTLATHYAGTTRRTKAGAVWTGKLALAPEHIVTWPLRCKKPRMIFVNSMGDLFHEDCPDEWIDKVFAVMALCPQHTFQVLTKRAERMRAYCSTLGKHWTEDRVSLSVIEMAKAGIVSGEAHFWYDLKGSHFVIPNVWLGVSAEDQKRANERIPHLLATPSAMRFVSAEPLLGPIDLCALKTPCLALPGACCGDQAKLDALRGIQYCSRAGAYGWPDRVTSPLRTLDWIIVGGESGPDARPMHPDWARSIRDQCHAAGVPFFFKQHGEFVSVSIVEGEGPHFHFPDGTTVRRTGKRAAGRLLDGRTHDCMPGFCKSKP